MSQPEKLNYYLITGTSRGIGEALAKKLLGDGNFIYCISRNPNPSIGVEAFIKQRFLKDLPQDLNQVQQIRDLVREVFRHINPEQVASITLINNAGIVHPIRQIGSGEASDKIIRNINVNLTAAMLITDGFIRETQDWGVPRKVLNMTTGAARRPMAAWSAYCTAKAGLEMYSHCLAKEQAGQENPVKVVAFAPGVVNTEMQSEIRSADAEGFADKSRFVNLHKNGELFEPDFVAETIIKLLDSPDFGSKTIMDIREDFNLPAQ